MADRSQCHIHPVKGAATLNQVGPHGRRYTTSLRSPLGVSFQVCQRSALRRRPPSNHPISTMHRSPNATAQQRGSTRKLVGSERKAQNERG